MPTKQELTNGIVNDIKSRLEKFKQNKKTESNSKNAADEFGNIDISKDLLEKFKKSIIIINITYLFLILSKKIKLIWK